MEYYEATSALGFFVEGACACAGWMVGLLVAVVGFVSARGALPRAGYLIGAAGLALLVQYCCVFVPRFAYRAQLVEPELFPLLQATNIGGMLLRLVFVALFLGGAVILAREVKARRAGAGGA